MPKKVSKPKKSAAKKTKFTNTAVNHVHKIYHFAPRFVHGMVVGAIVGALVVVPLWRGAVAEALTIKSIKDCDSWSIINCGVQSTAALKTAYNNSKYVRSNYNYFKITSDDISNIGRRAVKGTVYDNGKIKVNGKVVATNAKTAARKRVTDADKRVSYNGATFYTRPIKVSWSHTSGPAYVVLKNGIFDYAVIASCGNPITATPTKTPPPTVDPVPTPSPTNPEPTPTPEPEPTPPVDEDITPQKNTVKVRLSSVKTLPNTGIGALTVVFLCSIIGGYAFHATHRHVKKRRQPAGHA